MVPALKIESTAISERLRLVIGPVMPDTPPAGNTLVINPPEAFLILFALMSALSIDAFVDTAIMLPALKRLPVKDRLEPVPKSLMTETFLGTASEARL